MNVGPLGWPVDWLTGWFAHPQPVISEAASPDAAALAALHGRCFRRGWGTEEMEQLLLDSRVLAHRAMIGRSLAGFMMSRAAAGEAEILSVAVDVARRSRGLASALLDLHLRRLAGLGVASVFLEVEAENAAACRLYGRAGFREVGRRPGYYPQAEGASAALVMRRDL